MKYEAKNAGDASGIGEAFQRRRSPDRPHPEHHPVGMMRGDARTAAICCVEALEWVWNPSARASPRISLPFIAPFQQYDPVLTLAFAGLPKGAEPA